MIEKQTFSAERSLYHLQNTTVRDCVFAGEEDGESPLKEGREIRVEGCRFALRYALWHDEGLTLTDSALEQTCRAPLWYCRDASLQNVTGRGVKALRECRRVRLQGCDFESEEPFWNCRDVLVENSRLVGFYAFFGSENITARHLDFAGKYSFQYTRGVQIADSTLDTKDAFWHSKDVTVTDCTVKGEYLGWYAENLTLVRCRISGTQPFCYCKNLTLVDCTMDGCDFSFENSSVHADVRGEILSVKNPASGVITADGYGEIILEEDAPYPVQGKVVVRGKEADGQDHI